MVDDFCCCCHFFFSKKSEKCALMENENPKINKWINTVVTFSLIRVSCHFAVYIHLLLLLLLFLIFPLDFNNSVCPLSHLHFASLWNAKVIINSHHYVNNQQQQKKIIVIHFDIWVAMVRVVDAWLWMPFVFIYWLIKKVTIFVVVSAMYKHRWKKSLLSLSFFLFMYLF